MGGLTVTAGSASTTTSETGAFTLSGITAGQSATFSASTIVTRTTRLQPAIDVFRTDTFDLEFYRKLARNGYEQPLVLQPIRRWTRTPQVYIRSVDEAGKELDRRTLDFVASIVRDAIPQWTSGLLSEPSITIGPESRTNMNGWLTIRFPDHNTANDTPGICGRASVGMEGGFIELNYYNYLATTNPSNGWCYVQGYPIAPNIIRHEIGHALGLWHTGSTADLMSGLPWSESEKNRLPAPREVTHLKAMYARPVGNIDPDTDPAQGVTSFRQAVVIAIN